MTSGSTPVASGSSVPVWPTRRVPSARRTRADDVVRSRARRLVDDEDAVHRRTCLQPFVDGLHEPIDDAGLNVLELPGDGEAGCVLVAAAAELACATTRTSTSYFERMLTRISPFALLEEHNRLDLARRQRKVDEPSVSLYVQPHAASIASSMRRTARRPSSTSSIASSSAPISFSLPKLLLS